MLYSELQCSEAIHKAVERMGFAEMTEVQEKTIPVMLAGRDVIAKAPTGTGKTCAFGIPVAEHIDPALKAPQAVILAPTRELAQQIAEELTGLTYFMPEVQVVCVYGGANMEKQAKRLAEGCQIVVATPGRLMDHYKHHNIDLDHVTQVVLDEADEMLNMGFYKDVKHIIGLMKARKSLSMFSATISREVMDIGWMYQKDAEEITVQPKEESQPKITQYMLETSGRNKLSDLAQIIIGESYKRVMVFCDTKFNTATLANQLARLGFSVDCLHGDLSQNERNRIMQNFRDGKLNVLVATDVAARGIDISELSHVFNYDLPEVPETYVHRIGRTARAGADGTAVSFCAPEEMEYLAGIEKLNRRKIPVVSGHPWDGVPAPVKAAPPVRGRKPKAEQPAPEKAETPKAEKAAKPAAPEKKSAAKPSAAKKQKAPKIEAKEEQLMDDNKRTPGGRDNSRRNNNNRPRREGNAPAQGAGRGSNAQPKFDPHFVSAPEATPLRSAKKNAAIPAVPAQTIPTAMQNRQPAQRSENNGRNGAGRSPRNERNDRSARPAQPAQQNSQRNENRSGRSNNRNEQSGAGRAPRAPKAEQSGRNNRSRSNNVPTKDEDPGLVLISRRPPQQKFTSFEEYMNAHGGATAPIEDHSEEV